MHRVSECPICDSQTFSAYLQCKDYTVSHETFQIVACDNCGLKLTNPRPDDTTLGRYYISDSYISHSDKSDNVIDRTYKIARNWALNWKLTQVKKYTKKSTGPLLDYGCGTGYFLERAKQNGFAVTGVEPSAAARTIASNRTAVKIHESLETIQGEFQTITLWHVLEHVSNLNETIASLENRLAKNGTMFIAVPNHQSHDAKKYGEHWAGYDVPRHLWHFDQSSMQALLRKHSVTIVEKIPMKLDSFYVSMLSENYLNGNKSFMNITRGFAEGLRSNLAANDNNYSSIIYVAKHQ